MSSPSLTFFISLTFEAFGCLMHKIVCGKKDRCNALFYVDF